MVVAMPRQIIAKISKEVDSGITETQSALRKKTSKKPSKPQDMGETVAISCIYGGIMNLGTIMPPKAPNIILLIPPKVVAWIVVFAKTEIKRAKHMAAILVAEEMMASPKNDEGPLRELPPSIGTINIPTKTISIIWI